MFDVGFFELVVIATIGLFVIGPERLPGAIRAVAMWVGRIRYFITETRTEFEKQIGADDIRRELHNEQVMRSLETLKNSKRELEEKIQDSYNNPQNNLAPEKDKESDYELPDFYPHDENGLALTESNKQAKTSEQEGFPSVHADIEEPQPTEHPAPEQAQTSTAAQEPVQQNSVLSEHKVKPPETQQPASNTTDENNNAATPTK